jgi:hypothetical protein
MKNTMSYVEGGGLKSAQKSHVLIEWPLNHELTVKVQLKSYHVIRFAQLLTKINE